MFKAFLIDPVTRTIREVQCNPSLREIYGLLSGRFKVDSIQGLRLAKDSVVYIDEEGRCKGPRDDMFWIKGEYFGRACEWDVFGRGLIFGPADEEGGETDAPFTLEEVTAMVRWVEVE